VCGVFRVGGRWLVVAGGVEGELAQQFAGGGVDDADVQVLDERQGVGPAGAGGMELPGVAEGDFAVGAGAVGADAVVGAGGAVARGWLWAGLRTRWRGVARWARRWCAARRPGPARTGPCAR